MPARDDGSATLELVLLTPLLLLLLLLVVLGGRYAQTRADVDAASRDAARAASLARDSSSAKSAASDAARSRLTEGGVMCRTLDVSVDTSDFRAGGNVVSTVACTVDLSDLTGLGVPVSRTLSATFAEPIDEYRRTGP